MHIPNFSLFSIPQLVIHYQSYKKQLDKKKESGKQLTTREKNVDTQILNQLRLRLNEISGLKNEQIYMETVFPLRAEVFFKVGSKTGEGVVEEYDGLKLKVKFADKLSEQKTVTGIFIPYTLCHLKYISYVQKK